MRGRTPCVEVCYDPHTDSVEEEHATDARRKGNMASIVLVHGAFHGGWCWREAAERLRTAGHRVFTPTLTGLGERSHLISKDVNLQVHIQDLINVIEWEELTDVVLVAHSYGGMPVTGAADAIAERLAALVYLDAYTPDDGDAVQVVRQAVPGAFPLTVSEDGFRVLPPAAEVFGVHGALAQWVNRRMTLHPLPTLTQPIHLSGAWRQVPKKMYIRTRQFPAPYFDRYLAAAEADPTWHAIARDAPHNVMMTDPDWFVDVLQQHIL
jgi:pimeloyl-ACP methyl ester carboxylesterase